MNAVTGPCLPHAAGSAALLSGRYGEGLPGRPGAQQIPQALLPHAAVLLQVDFWSLAEGEQPLSMSTQCALLDPLEAARMDSLRRPQDRQRYLAAHAGLRQRLARWLAVSPSALRFGTDALGKPTLADYPALFFNLSHSEGYAMLALATAPVGVDLERLVEPGELSTEFLQQIVAPGEMLALLAMKENERAAGLTAHWVCKEAVMKATGLGVRLAPTDVVVDSATGLVTLSGEWSGQPHEWLCHLVDAPDGYRAAIALSA